MGFHVCVPPDLSLKNIPARLQRLRDRKPGGSTLVYVAANSLNHPILRKKKNFCNGKFSVLLFPTSSAIRGVNLCPSHQHPTSRLLTTFAKKFVFLSAELINFHIPRRVHPSFGVGNGICFQPLSMLSVVTRRIPFIWIPLSHDWDSKEIYDLTLRQPWIQLHGISDVFAHPNTTAQASTT
jgi:hypothetical protein